MQSQGRYHMQKNGVMVEHHYRKTLEAIRRTDTRFKRARIKHVIQCKPSSVRVGVVYELTP